MSMHVLLTMACYVRDHEPTTADLVRDGHLQLLDAVHGVHARWGCDPDPDCGPRHRAESHPAVGRAGTGADDVTDDAVTVTVDCACPAGSHTLTVPASLLTDGGTVTHHCRDTGELYYVIADPQADDDA